MPNPQTDSKVKSAFVGLLIFGRDAHGVGVVISRRACTDSFPGACQVTAHGKLSEEELDLPEMEGYAKALLREVFEELGREAASFVARHLEVLSLLKDCNNSIKGKRVVTFGLHSSVNLSDLLGVFEPEPGVVLEIIRPQTNLLKLEPSHKLLVVPSDEIRMFPDEIESVLEAFFHIEQGARAIAANS